MKTSNKILLILLANLILIPAALMLALSAKVKSGNYVLGMTEYEKEARAIKPISNTGLLKLTAPEGVQMECTIHYSDSVYYRKYGSAVNNLSVGNSGDTLVFSIAADADDKHEENTAVHLDLFMPFSGLLMLDGASATLDSVAVDAEIEVAMQNNSMLLLGKGDSGQKSKLKFASLFVEGTNSNLTITDHSAIKKLVLKLGGESKLFFGKELQLDSLDGTVSTASTVSGSAKWIYQLKQLP